MLLAWYASLSMRRDDTSLRVDDPDATQAAWDEIATAPDAYLSSKMAIRVREFNSLTSWSR
jgi:hypothetical protein